MGRFIFRAAVNWALMAGVLATTSGGMMKWPGVSVDFGRGRLKVSGNNRFLVHEDGTAFFYLGDTAWELFHNLTREDAERYLENRRAKGFTVIQAVALAERDGLERPNAYGHRPLLKVNGEYDPARPDGGVVGMTRTRRGGLFDVAE